MHSKIYFHLISDTSLRCKSKCFFLSNYKLFSLPLKMRPCLGASYKNSIDLQQAISEPFWRLYILYLAATLSDVFKGVKHFLKGSLFNKSHVYKKGHSTMCIDGFSGT